jgi:hypothetical protein
MFKRLKYSDLGDIATCVTYISEVFWTVDFNDKFSWVLNDN